MSVSSISSSSIITQSTSASTSAAQSTTTAAALAQTVASAASTVLGADETFGETVAKTSAGERPDYSVSNPLGTISGFTNYNPIEMRAFSEWKRKLAEVYRVDGFTSIETRPLEYAQTLLKKGGLDKQMYGVSRLQDGSLTKLGIPFDRTVPTAIFVADHFNEIAFPYHRWDIAYSYRGEHASKGRYRAFYQADVDIFDRKLTACADAQTIATTVKGLRTLGVTKCNVTVNHIGITKTFISDAGIPQKHMNQALNILDGLKPDNKPTIIKELMGAIPMLTLENAERLLKDIDYEGPLKNYKTTEKTNKIVVEAFKHLLQVEGIMVGLGLEPGMIKFSPSLTRGLDYYTGIVMETFIPGKERYGSIASGGRYSDLVDGLSDKGTGIEGVGMSIGLTRLFDVMKDEKLVDLTSSSTAQVMVCYRTMKEFPKAIEVTQSLRSSGLYVELYSAEKIKIKNELDLCNKKGIPFAILVMNSNELVIRNMTDSTQTSHTTVEALKSKFLEDIQSAEKLAAAEKTTPKGETAASSAATDPSKAASSAAADPSKAASSAASSTDKKDSSKDKKKKK